MQSSIENHSDKLHHIENQIERITFETGEKIGSLASAVTNTTLDYKENAENFIEKNPVKALAIAAGAGLVVGCLISYLLRKKN